MFKNNKYTLCYYRIINHRLQFPAVGYTEKHHIIPKCLGGLNDKTNLVNLTGREHFICHHLLTKMTEGRNRQRMWFAVRCFTAGFQKARPEVKITSKLFELIRIESAQFLSDTRSGWATRPAGTYTHSIETKQKMSATAIGIIKRPAGFKHSIETIELMKVNSKGKNSGKPSWNKNLVQVCPHCNKSVGGTLNRWHGDNCKLKII